MAEEYDKSLETTKRIFDLYRKYGGEDYIGEPLSQTEHMIQCAMLAEKEDFSDEVILGALFHDIGHLIGFEEQSPQMGEYGTEKHEIIGEKFLSDLGFPESVTKMVGGHVDAKRYLVYKYEDFYEKLSAASKQTLIHQGGPMSAEEASAFEKLPVFKALIQMRTWDDKGKIEGLPIEPLSKYEDMCIKYLKSINK
ncbi:uncharacterized protein LOC110244149 [Exaiptasia diaphana]|uniref:HD domain-containing protein n=1 Tax=Exaiptasia diaphana TaxID=2652724 RepID=A0A913XLC0_EXADI|nr:uncharacterized protein LOC110244149 [Exaiptasia diaphana]KXJ25652.1 Uncharacterized protein L432 [Exaiptasia diaphana]